MSPSEFRKNLLSWYRRESRKALPWRQTKNPYRIWISEAMLQQTQVNTVIPYYRRFLARFPTVHALSEASLSEVLEVWSGLGYYHRAKNLRACAQQLVREQSGQLPEDPESLQKLPGIGRTTAGAIASIAFDRPAPVLDGNVQRVLCRYFGIRQDPRQPAAQRRLWDLAARLVPRDSPGDFNQALMDLGATVCTPRKPQCNLCPLSPGCKARRHRLQEKIPPPRTPARRTRVDYLCGIVEKNGSVLIARRPESGLLPGLWEFPGGEIPRPGGLGMTNSDQQTLQGLFSNRLGLRVRAVRLLAAHTQILSHRELQIRAYLCRPIGSRLRRGAWWRFRQRQPLRPSWYSEARWVPKSLLEKVPFTAGMRDISRVIQSPISRGARRGGGAGSAARRRGKPPGTGPARADWMTRPRR